MKPANFPEHIEAQLRQLIAEGLPAEEIAFMMKLDKKVVEEAINTTQGKAAVSGGQQ